MLAGNNALYQFTIPERLALSFRIRIVKEAGLMVLGKKISPHHFRTYVITELRLAGKSNVEIQSISGQANSNMIDYYSMEKPKIENVKTYLL
jgi:hypothetical protein